MNRSRARAPREAPDAARDAGFVPGQVAAIVVAYRPDPHRLRQLLDRVAAQVGTVIVVDNSESERDRRAVAQAAGAARLLASGTNEGVACAQNKGIRAALRQGARFVLLLDDDSLPPPDLVVRLLEAMRTARRRGARPAAVGPFAFDERAPTRALVYAAGRFGPRRIPAEQPPDPDGLHGVAFLLASGSLIDAGALESAGLMREDLFIDHVDLEWALRARGRGWSMHVLRDLPMAHRLGDRVVRVPWPGRRSVHVHAPLRNYYLARNTLLLVRGAPMPALWRPGYLWWLAKYVSFNLVFVAPRAERLRMILRGIRDGLLGRSGAWPARRPHE